MGTGVIVMGHFFMGNRRSMWLFRDLATSCYLLHLLLFAATDSCFFFLKEMWDAGQQGNESLGPVQRKMNF